MKRKEITPPSDIDESSPPPPLILTPISALISSTPLPIIDIRSPSSFSSCRYLPPSVTVVNLPFSTLLSGDRSCELPPRDVRFDLVLDDDVSLAEVAELFTSRCALRSSPPSHAYITNNPSRVRFARALLLLAPGSPRILGNHELHGPFATLFPLHPSSHPPPPPTFVLHPTLPPSPFRACGSPTQWCHQSCSPSFFPPLPR